eukprot:16388057-Heterocapsa_arctica.AAC.1
MSGADLSPAEWKKPVHPKIDAVMKIEFGQNIGDMLEKLMDQLRSQVYSLEKKETTWLKKW